MNSELIQNPVELFRDEVQVDEKLTRFQPQKLDLTINK